MGKKEGNRGVAGVEREISREHLDLVGPSIISASRLSSMSQCSLFFAYACIS